MNKVILCGRLTADPELKQTTSGIATCRFTVAVDRRIANKETGEREADFVTCVAWRKTAEFLSKFFSKGKLICLEGSLRNNNYQDKNHSDVTHYTMEVQVDNIEFCGGKNDSGSNGGSQQSNNSPAEADTPVTDNTDDVPF